MKARELRMGTVLLVLISLHLALPMPAPAEPSISNIDSGTWSTTGTSPLHGRYRHSAIWTGEAMLVWGGYYHLDHFLNDGAMYDPVADTWEMISASGAPAGRLRHTAVWTGQKMIVWGGEHAGGGQTTNTGGIYDPASSQWTATSLTYAPTPRQLHSAIWTGTEMVVWGGCSSILCTTRYGDGYRYNPTADTWTQISTVGAPSPRFTHSTIWTGDEMIIWGGCDSTQPPCTRFLGDGARYNPSTDTWRPITTTLAPSARRYHTAVWTGSEMLVWGGESSLGYLADGARYNPTTDSWIAMSAQDAPSPRVTHTAVWSGEAMIIWGGNTNTGAIYSPSLDIWSTLPTEDAPASRAYHSAVWAGDRMIVWGGCDEFSIGRCNEFLNTGGTYIPGTVVWYRTYLPFVVKQY